MRFKIVNAVIGAGLYLWGFGFLFVTLAPIGIVALVYTIACMGLTRWMLVSAEARRAEPTIKFKRAYPLSAFGSEWSSFHYVFASDKHVIERFSKFLDLTLRNRLACQAMQETVIRDIDRDLDAPETRTFFVSRAKPTARRTNFALVLSVSRINLIQGVRWWILVSGVRDPNKVFWAYAMSPLVAPFAVIPYLRREHDPLRGLMSTDGGFFNGVDMLNHAREIEYVAYEALVELLDSYGIDTGDLKQQKSQMLNINVSGGQASFGAIVQGAMNKVAGSARRVSGRAT